MKKTATEIIDMISKLQATYAAYSTALVLLNDKDVLALMYKKGYDEGSTIRLGRRDNSYYEDQNKLNLWNSISAMQNNSGFNLDFLGSQATFILSWIGHELKLNSYFDKTPELEFFRHLRNGISHGNTFHFDKDEPKRPANFKNFEILKTMQGNNVLFEFISTGDVFDLLDHIKLHLRKFS